MQVLAPTPYASYATRSGTFTADGNGLISNAPVAALGDLQASGCTALAFNPLANFRNLIDGGDFTTNPFARGTTFTGITSTLTYVADRFFAVGGASSSISASQQAQTGVAGFADSLQFGRASANTNTAAITLGQVLETGDCIRVQGQTVTLSFWALAGANFSGTVLNVALQTGTGTNQSAANLIAGSWTTQSYVALTPNNTGGVAGTAGLYGTGTVATQTLQQTLIRYSFTGVIPSAATQIGVTFNYAPVGTAGANDWVQFLGVQLEVGALPSPFEHRDIQVELEIAQRYCYVVNEPASGVVVGAGQVTTSNNEVIYIPFPTQMVKAPTVTVGTSGSPTWKLNVVGTATAATLSAGTTHTANAMSLTAVTTATAGQAVMLQGGGGGGVITASADF
jgi:hypothetical protein